jgi:phytoene synthase
LITLEASYARCKQLNKRYGTTYYWSTHLLPVVKRHHVHALYGFCRYADDIVDDLGVTATPAERQAALTDFGDRFFVDLERGASDDAVLKAVVHTVKAFDLDPEYFRRFLRSMAMDFTCETYETFGDLLDYMDGSAAVIGEMMVPILEPLSPDAFGHARELGIAFQLSNFWRKFGADPWLRTVTPEWRELMAFEIARTRQIYASADLGIPMLPPASARCIAGARRLYSGILVEIEKAGYDVFTTRVRVPTWKKLAVAFRMLRP